MSTWSKEARSLHLSLDFIKVTLVPYHMAVQLVEALRYKAVGYGFNT